VEGRLRTAATGSTGVTGVLPPVLLSFLQAIKMSNTSIATAKDILGLAAIIVWAFCTGL
jgi:hypothetical protein